MVLNKSDELSTAATASKEAFNVVYLGESGFPVGFGAIQKMIMVSKALIEEGAQVSVICRKGSFDPDQERAIELKGNFEGIDYVYTSKTIYRPKGFWKRNIQKLKGIYGEYQTLRQFKKQNRLDAGIISCYHFGQVLLYLLYSYFLKFPVVYNYVEMARVLDSRKSFKLKINDFLFEKFLIPRMDGAFPISEVLIQQYKSLAPQKPFFKLPILCEFEKFDIKVPKPSRDFFLFCGALSYRETVDFILAAYDLLPENNPVDLHLVLGGGSKTDLENLKAYIATLKKSSQIKIFHNVAHSEIPKHYKPAKGLLIPMRPGLQDAARFPHKIGEYVASGNPMISINYGEVAHYFKDQVNALIAKFYTPEAFADKMQFVLDHPEEAQKIGEKGKALGLQAFNHLSYGKGILDFLRGLKGKQ